jgi:hypothetical protein
METINYLELALPTATAAAGRLSTTAASLLSR